MAGSASARSSRLKKILNQRITSAPLITAARVRLTGGRAVHIKIVRGSIGESQPQVPRLKFKLNLKLEWDSDEEPVGCL